MNQENDTSHNGHCLGYCSSVAFRHSGLRDRNGRAAHRPSLVGSSHGKCTDRIGLAGAYCRTGQTFPWRSRNRRSLKVRMPWLLPRKQVLSSIFGNVLPSVVHIEITGEGSMK